MTIINLLVYYFWRFRGKQTRLKIAAVYRLQFSDGHVLILKSKIHFIKQDLVSFYHTNSGYKFVNPLIYSEFGGIFCPGFTEEKAMYFDRNSQ